jgi:hypothetical protein
VRHVLGVEDAVVETVLTRQLVGDQSQELAGGGSLDDTVVVGGGHVHRLADAHQGQLARRDPRVLGGEVGGAHPDDQTLTAHEARHGGRRPQGAGVRQGDRRPGVVIGGELPGARTAHDVLVGCHELHEGQGVGLVDDGDDEVARPVGAGDVDGQTEADMRHVLHGRLGVLG